MGLCSGDVLLCVRKDGFSPTVTTSPPISSSFTGENALVDDSSCYCGSYKPNEWWMIDFKTNVMVKTYQIRALAQNGYIYNWKVEVSEDNSTWHFVHEQINTSCSNFPSFPTGYSNPFRYFKITGTGPSSGPHTDKIAFFYIKFIGISGVCQTKVICTCVVRNPFKLLPLMMTMIIS